MYYKTTFRGDWGINLAKDQNLARYHIVTKGDFWLELPYLNSEYKLEQGDIVIIPFGEAHKIRSFQDSEIMTEESLLKQAKHNIESKTFEIGEGKKKITNLICGHFNFNSYRTHPLISSLPPVLHITKKQLSKYKGANEIGSLINFESDSIKMGSISIINRLTEVIFIQIIRYYIESNKVMQNIAQGLSDPYIKISLEKIHDFPERRWKVEGLAKEVGLSRTLFSQKFKETTGQTPIGYLTNWRLHLAKNLLLKTNKSIFNIANDIGYQSEEHFQKIFKKTIGKSPTKFRKTYHL